MKAITVIPGKSLHAQVVDVDEPATHTHSLLVAGHVLGVCGTDTEIVSGLHGAAPPGRDRLILGHESLGEVLDAPAGSGFSPGDRVVGIVRRPDPEPCESCASGEWDFCRNGRYTEHGIKELDGFGCQLWRIEPDHAVWVPAELGDLGVLTEPTAVAAKAWEQIEHMSARASYTPGTVLVTGAGPIGLLAALIGIQRGYEVHVLDRVESGPKPAVVEQLGATYHSADVGDLTIRPDIVIDTTAAAEVVMPLPLLVAENGVICLTGFPLTQSNVSMNLDEISREMVLNNVVMFGSVNANRRHFGQAVDTLSRAEPAWLQRLITRTVNMDHFDEALHKEDHDIKTVVDLRW